MYKMKTIGIFFAVAAIFFSSCGTDSDEYPRSMEGYQAALDHCIDAVRAVAGKEEFDGWEFTVLKTDEKNAFCNVEEKKIVVFSGLMDEMNNEAELAFILGHELAHAVLSHSEKESALSDWLSVGALASKLSLDMVSEIAYNIVSGVGIMLPYSRSLESDADALGLVLMARAGYDPSASYIFWARNTDKNGELTRIGSYFSDHPCDASRIEAMKKDEAAAREEYGKAPVKYGFGKTFSDKK